MKQNFCKVCKNPYIPKRGQYTRQKYCSRPCKDRAQRERDKKAGNARSFKGGFPRATILRLFLHAKSLDDTIPCHYEFLGCKNRLTADNFQVDHKIPVSQLRTKKEYLEESNLVLSCAKCNQDKKSLSYSEYIKKKNADFPPKEL